MSDPKVSEEEPSCEDAFALFFTDKAFHDIKLEGNDGVKVSANRNALAVRSKVFRKMLLGEFAEAKKDVVKIDYDSAVLSAVAAYIHTGTAPILAPIEAEQGTGISSELSASIVIEFETLLSLAAAAEFFDLPRLCKLVHKCLSSRLNVHPSLSFELLQTCKETGITIPTELEELAWSNIQSGGTGLVVNAVAVKVSSPLLLEDIVTDDKLAMDNYTIFGMLNLWKDAFDSTESGDQDRQSTAKSLVATHVNLEQIDPGLLSSIVAQSGLVTLEQLAEAYKRQAMVAKEVFDIDFGKPIVVWKNSLKDVFSVSKTGLYCSDALCIPSPMISGTIHRWTIEIQKQASPHAVHVWLGIATKEIAHDLGNFLGNTYIGNKDSNWSYRANGELRHNGSGQTGGQTYGAGSKVTFLLNLLSDGDGSGTLSACVGNGAYFTLFDNLHGQLTDGGFVPAASYYQDCSIRLLAFDQVQNIEE